MSHSLNPATSHVPNQVNVLIVEDSSEQRAELMAALKQHNSLDGFNVNEVYEAATGEAARHIASSCSINLVLLDSYLPNAPGMSPSMIGKDLCKEFRKMDIVCPIIAITGAALSDEDEIDYLQAGANDYLRKPFSVPVLMARVKIQLEAFQQSTKVEYTFGPWVFKPIDGTILKDNKRYYTLTKSESIVLHLLCQTRGSITPKVHFLIALNYAPDVNTHTLATHIYRLRQKLEQNPQRPCLLMTQSGGYMLTA